MSRVIGEGALLAVAGVFTGALCGLALARVAAGYLHEIQMPGALPIIASARVLLIAAVVASLVPALRAARVDITQALRAD